MPRPDAAPVQSYPTFWDAVPVDDPAPRPAPADAYALFADAADPAGPRTLFVEQTDVG